MRIIKGKTFYNKPFDIVEFMADRKTENCSEKPNNCETCRFDDKYGDESICSSCSRHYSDCYEPKDEPQTDCSWK